MKVAIPALLAVFAFNMACLAEDKPRTIVTRDHQTYENAVITGHDDASVNISFDSGVVRVALENLPADIQKELGYISKIPEPPEEVKSVPPTPPAAKAAAVENQPVASPQPPPIVTASPPILEEHTPAPVKPSATPAKIFTQAMAGTLYGMKESVILKKWGKPLRIEKITSLSQRKAVVLIYDEDESMGTKFFIYEKDGFVSGGLCDGKVIRSPAQDASLDKTKTAGN